MTTHKSVMMMPSKQFQQKCACLTLQGPELKFARLCSHGQATTSTLPCTLHTVDAHRSQVITVHTDTEEYISISGHCTH